MNVEAIRGSVGHDDPAKDYTVVAIYEPEWRNRAINSVIGRLVGLSDWKFDLAYQEHDGDIPRPVWFVKINAAYRQA